MSAGNYLAVICLLFGAAFAAFFSGSLEQRIENLFSLGLIPAVGFYVGGHALGQLLVFGVKLCDMIMARCSRYAVHSASGLLNWIGTQVSNWVTGGDARTKLNFRSPNRDEFRIDVRGGWHCAGSRPPRGTGTCCPDSERFRLSHRTRRPVCGRLTMRQTDSGGEAGVRRSAPRVHHASRRRGGGVAVRGACTAGADAPHPCYCWRVIPLDRLSSTETGNTR
jgi:hypothetical protein